MLSIGAVYRAIYFGADLKSVYLYSGSSNVQRSISLEVSYEHGQDVVCADNGVRAMDQLCAHRGSLWRRFRCAQSGLPGTVPRHGLRATDLPPEPARPPTLSSGEPNKALQDRK